MTSVINIKTDPRLKQEAQKVVSSMGLTLTGVINNYLKYLVETKSVSFGSTSNPTKTPYGMFSGLKFTNKDIDEITKSWEKAI